MLTPHVVVQRSGRQFAVLSTFVLTGALWSAAYAQQAAPPPAPEGATVPTLDAQEIQARLKKIEGSDELGEPAKKKLVEAYQDVLGQLKIADEWATKATQYQQAMDAAPSVLAEIKAELSKPQAEMKAEAQSDASIAQLEQLLAKVEAELAGARKTAEDWENQAKLRASRRLEVPKLLAAAQQRMDEIKQQIATPAPAETPELGVARRAQQLSRQRAAEQENAAYEKEISSYDARGELLTARRDLAARRVAESEKLAAAWRVLVNDRRKVEAEKAARQARAASREAARAHPSVKALAEENARLAELRTGKDGLAARIAATSQGLQDITQTLKRLRDSRQGVEQRIEAAGLTTALAMVLRRQRDELPDTKAHARKIRTREDEIGSTQLRLFELQERRTALSHIDGRIEEIVGSLDTPTTAEQREDIRFAARDLLDTQRNLIEALTTDYQAYAVKLSDLDAAERQLVAETERHLDYINRRILWTRSTAALRPSDLKRAAREAYQLAAPGKWMALLQVAGDDARTNVALYAVLALVFASLLVGRLRLRKRIRATAQAVAKTETDSLAHTLDAAVVTLLLALPWPLLMGFVSWRLQSASAASDFTRTIGAGLYATARCYFVLALLRAFCRPDGLGQIHFQWRSDAIVALRRYLRRLILVGLPLVFVVASVEFQSSEDMKESLGRLAFIAGLLVLTGFVHAVMRPSGTFIQSLSSRHRGGLLERFRYVWYTVAALTPLALALVAATGYYYAAQEMEHRLRMTFLLILGLGAVHEFLIRGLYVIRRKLAVRKYQERRRAEDAQQEAEHHPEGEAAPRPADEMNIYKVSAQARGFVAGAFGFGVLVGMWLIWVDVLPALGILNEVELWSTTVRETRTEQRADGPPVLTTHETIGHITLADVALALLVVVITVVSVRNIPGLLEIAILHRLPFDHGVRFAITSILRYLMIVIGTVLAFGMIGVEWSHVQWLIAAMTVGLGFGLQEIFANFVSGLIILFERPVRVGDTVTVGDIIGTVTQIRIRATTITDWDCKELVVPNKEFITGRLVNWTLSDPIIRRSFPVGIAYGSNTDLAMEALLAVAGENDLVLDDPPPKVVFTEFGDSSLNFDLRVFVRGIAHYIEIWGQINYAIDQAFRKAGIEIAFPQRDLHVRSIRADLPVVDSRPDEQSPSVGE